MFVHSCWQHSYSWQPKGGSNPNSGLDKPNGTHTFNGIMFSLKKKGNSDPCSNIDEPWRHYMRAKSFQPCPTLCDSMDHSLQAPLSMEFSSQESNPHFFCLLHCQAGSLPVAPPRKPWRHYAEWNKSVMKGLLLYNSTYMKFLGLLTSLRQLGE